MSAPGRPDGDDLLDVAVVAARLWQGRRTITLSVLAGVGFAALVFAASAPRWDARATVLTQASRSGGVLDRVGVPEGLTAAVAGASAGGAMDTELELLRSRQLVDAVGDAHQVAAVVRRPRAVPATRVIARFRSDTAFAPYRLSGRREGRGWRVQGRGLDTVVAAGAELSTPVGLLVLADSAPSEFRLTLLDAEDAWQRVQDRLNVARAGGDIAEVRVRWDDRETGAAMANGIVGAYLAWRREMDESDNASQGVHLRSEVDSLEGRLAMMLDSLRRFQDRSDAADPPLRVRTIVDLLATERSELQAATVEAEAVQGMLTRLATDSTSSVRSLPALPPLQRSPAINELVVALQRLEAERAVLLGTRTARDPGVVAREQSIRALQAQLGPMAEAYLTSMRRAQAELRRGIDSLTTVLARAPREGRVYYDITREVERLTKSLTQLQAQLLQVEVLSGEGGGRARQVDVARPARRPVVPRLPLYLAVGVALGALVGALRLLLQPPPPPAV